MPRAQGASQVLELEKLDVQPAYQVVGRELQRHIVSGALKPGQPLPSETELAARFGVNRSTVREGIRQLESEGLVRRHGRKKLLVTVPLHTDLAPRAARALVMHAVTFRELWDVAFALEPLAAGLAARNATPGDVERLRANVEATAAAVERGESPGALDLEFHALVAAAAANNALLLAREPIGSLLYPTFEAFRPRLPQADGRLVAAHREIVTGIAQRDADYAVLWMTRHIQDLKRGWLMAQLDLDDRIDPSLVIGK